LFLIGVKIYTDSIPVEASAAAGSAGCAGSGTVALKQQIE
jgi:hypothetical protein